jgi:DNA repair exonuclease SbcCD ATPase subunit
MGNQDRFRFEPGDEEPEIAVADEELKKRVNRLSQRISFLTLLLPSLIAIVIYVAYHDLTQRLTRAQSSDLRSVEKLATAAEQKTEALSARLGEIEAALAQAANAQTKLQALQEVLRRGESEMDKLNAAKADKKEVEEAAKRNDEALATVNKNVQALSKELQALAPFREELGVSATLRSEIQTLSGRLQKLEGSLGKDLTGLAGYMDRSRSELEKVKSELSGLQARKLDRDSLELEILKAKRLYQIALDQEIARIDKAVNAVQRRLEQVERLLGSKSSSAAPSLPPLTGGIKEQPVE